jgi:hypothetical protein
MALDIEITRLPTPFLEFGGPGEFTDPRNGLREAGPFDLRFGVARREQVNVGLVGPEEMLQRAVRWLERCRGRLAPGEAGGPRDPSYPGFEELFHASLRLDSRWMVAFQGTPSDLDRALDDSDQRTRFNAVLDLYAAGVSRLADLEAARPDVVVCCLPGAVVAKCWSISNELSYDDRAAAKSLRRRQESRQLDLFDSEPVEETEEDLLNRDFRRALKARAMRSRMPIQLATDDLLIDDEDNQSPAKRAWNSTVALYYKAGGIPWRLKTDGPETCFVGISFHHLRTRRRHLVRSSIAQAFSTQGEGFALRGGDVPWDREQGRNVHLTEEQAHGLGAEILEEYRERAGGTPVRVVLHKTSEFSEAERSGFRSAFHMVPVVELINIMQTGFRLLRQAAYPPARGTLCRVNGDATYLYTTGFVPELETYPGPHVPTPARIKSDGPIDIARAAADILGLTRMNWNTADITGGAPVTLSFARRVGGIMAEYGDEDRPLSSFRFYI